MYELVYHTAQGVEMLPGPMEPALLGYWVVLLVEHVDELHNEFRMPDVTS